MICFPIDLPADEPCQAAVLGCDPVAVRTARALTRSALDAWSLPGLRDDAELVVSELVTNAQRYASRVAFAVVLRPATGEIEVAVWDDGPGTPAISRGDADLESGRGLVLVAACSTEWGCRAGKDGTGKVTWARLGPNPRDEHDANA